MTEPLLPGFVASRCYVAGLFITSLKRVRLDLRPRVSGVARPQFLGVHFDINKLLLINIYFNRDLYYVVALYTNGHDRIGRFCSYQLNRASSLWTFLYVVTIIKEHAHNFWGNIVPPMFPRSYASARVSGAAEPNAVPLLLRASKCAQLVQNCETLGLIKSVLRMIIE